MEKLTLKALRAQKNLTQKDVATAIDVSLATYNRYEQNPKTMMVDTLVKLADLFGVTIGDIFLP